MPANIVIADVTAEADNNDSPNISTVVTLRFDKHTEAQRNAYETS